MRTTDDPSGGSMTRQTDTQAAAMQSLIREGHDPFKAQVAARLITLGVPKARALEIASTSMDPTT
jgi:hypothetical protein